MLTTYSLSGLTVVTPDSATPGSSIQVDQKKLGRLGGKSKFDLRFGDGFAAFPALINIHDHFNGNYLPKVGPPPGEFYINWSYWDRDLKNSDVVKVERARTSVEERYFLSAYKNIFSGVVTANDHFPHEWNEPFIPRLPMRVIRNYTLAHACSSFDLKWGDGFEIEHARAVKNDFPFITHLEEGFDPETQAGIETLEAAGCLDDHTVMIHCIGFSDEDIQKVRRAGAHVSWCAELERLHVQRDLQDQEDAGGRDQRRHRHGFHGHRFHQPPGGDAVRPRRVPPHVRRGPAGQDDRQHGDRQPREGVPHPEGDGHAVGGQARRRPGRAPAEGRSVGVPGGRADGGHRAPRAGRVSHLRGRRPRGAVRRARRPVHEGHRPRTADAGQGRPGGLMERVRKAVGFRKVLDFIPLDT